jgi:hypothetical protein
LPDESTPLIGIFGFLKPYKADHRVAARIPRLFKSDAEGAVAAVRRESPELPLPQLFSTLGLNGEVRHIDFAPLEDFVGYIAACDIILNLRYPTVGETSGTLQRAARLGPGRPGQRCGSFRRVSGRICLKVPVDALEEDLISSISGFSTSRPDLAQAMGDRRAAGLKASAPGRRLPERYVDFPGKPRSTMSRRILPETMRSWRGPVRMTTWKPT